MLFSNKLVSSGIMQPLRGETRKACTRPMEQPMLRNVNTSRLMQAKLCGKFVTVKMNYLINYISATGRLETSSCDKDTETFRIGISSKQCCHQQQNTFSAEV